MTGCSSGVTTEEQAEKVARALKSVQATDEDFFDSAWLGKKPQNASMEDWHLTESEEQDAASQQESEADMEAFLAGLGVAASSAAGTHLRLGDAAPKSGACDKARKPKEPSNAGSKPKQIPEACDKALEKDKKLQKFDQSVDQLSSCDMSNAKRNTRKMVSLLAAEIKTAQAVARKHSEHRGLKQSLEKMQKLHSEVEKAMVDEKKEKALMALLTRAAKVVKSHKRIVDSI